MTLSQSKEPALLTLGQAAQVLSVSKRTLERLIAGGSFPAPLKIGRSSRVATDDLNSYLRDLHLQRVSKAHPAT